MSESNNKTIGWSQSSEEQACLFEAEFNGSGHLETCKVLCTMTTTCLPYIAGLASRNSKML